MIRFYSDIPDAEMSPHRSFSSCPRWEHAVSDLCRKQREQTLSHPLLGAHRILSYL